MKDNTYLYSRNDELKSWMIIIFNASNPYYGGKPSLNFVSRWEDDENQFGGGSQKWSGKAWIDETCNDNIDWKTQGYDSFDDEYEDDLFWLNALEKWEDHMDEVINYIKENE